MWVKNSCFLPSHIKTSLPEETIRVRNLCWLSKQIKFQICNNTEVWLEAIAEATSDTLPSGFLIKAAADIIIWQMAAGFHTIGAILFFCAAVNRKGTRVIVFKCSFFFFFFYILKLGTAWSLNAAFEGSFSLEFHVPGKERLSSGPQWSNLLRQHTYITHPGFGVTYYRQVRSWLKGRDIKSSSDLSLPSEILLTHWGGGSAMNHY